MEETTLTQLPNIGLRSSLWLRDVGITDAQQLKQTGAVAAFIKIKKAGHHPSRNLLYALAGAIQGCHWSEIKTSQREALNTAAQNATSATKQADKLTA